VPSTSSIDCSRKAPIVTADRPRVEVRRHFAAAPERVFAAFADARLVERWLSPSPDVPITVRQLDFREGGAYRFAYGVPEGPAVIVGGTYLTIEVPRKIVFSWIIEPPDEHAGIESEVSVTITPSGAGTELVIRHDKLTRTDAEARHAEGWRGALDQLITVLESTPP
jgi:uncharacterized protein YndB with AHSA1/START domain